MVEQRACDIVLDLIVLSFNFSWSKWNLKSPMVEGNKSKFEFKSVNFNPEENSLLKACVLLRSCINVFKIFNF
jgi:hypothetical protein